MKIIELFEGIPEQAPSSELAPIWGSLSPVLRHYKHINAQEATISMIQQSFFRDRAMMTPSIYGGDADICRRSFYLPHIFVYLFRKDSDRYFWITCQLDRCYSFGAIFISNLNTIITLYPFTINGVLIEQIRHLEECAIEDEERVRDFGHPIRAVTGFFHIMHVLWNELPAMERAVTSGSISDVPIYHAHQPLGPLAEIFPEIASQLRWIDVKSADFGNQDARFSAALGSDTITISTQERINRVAQHRSKPHLTVESSRFRADHWPIFWISVKPPNRSFLDQGRILSEVMCHLKSRYARAGFILNGVGTPWDLFSNSNYHSWFIDMLEQASLKTSQIIAEILENFDSHLLHSTKVLTDIDVLEEVRWGAQADFYFCHGGSMQNKVAWVNDIPGVIHSNSRFIESIKYTKAPTFNRSPVYFLPENLIIDDIEEKYSDIELSRKDQNYSLIDIHKTAIFIAEKFEESRQNGPL